MSNGASRGSTPVRLIRSPLSIAGMVLTTISAVVFLVVFFADLFGMHTNPYIGIVFFLILPGIFIVGLLLIPLGAWIERRRRAAGKQATEWPRVDLNNPDHRRVAVAIFTLTMVVGRTVGIGAYLVRLGQRTIQKTRNAPIILTGYQVRRASAE